MNQSEKTRNLELRLLNELRKDGSQSISLIARKLRKPVTTVFEAEKKLRKKRITSKYYSVVDFEKAGFPIRAQFLIEVSAEKLQKTAAMLMADKSVNNLQVLEGGCNIFAEAVFAGMGRFVSFSEKLGCTRKKSVFYVVGEAKTEAASLF